MLNLKKKNSPSSRPAAAPASAGDAVHVQGGTTAATARAGRSYGGARRAQRRSQVAVAVQGARGAKPP